jgi:hypothetical protein
VLRITGHSTATFERFLHAASEDMLRKEDRNLAEKPSRVVTVLVGKAYLKSATAAIAANGFPVNFKYKTCMILGEFQRNITSCLLENPVPCTRIAEESRITSGTNLQTLNISHSSCFTKHHSCPSL